MKNADTSTSIKLELKVGEIRRHSKSGNKVRLISKEPPKRKTSPEEWKVVRVDGDSAGKEMICLASALLIDDGSVFAKE